MLNQQTYKMAAPGAGVIVYRHLNEENAAEVLLSERSAEVGQGLGITGGGFFDCEGLMEKPVGAISLTVDEAFREVCEENARFENVIDATSFRQRAKHLTSFAVRTGDMHGVHAVSYFALLVDDAEFAKIQALPAGDERKGALKPTKLLWTAASLKNPAPADQFFMEGKERFYHKHELLGFAALAHTLA